MTPFLLFRTLLAIIGMVMASYSVYLLALKKLHLGIVLPLVIGIGLVTWALFAPRWLNWLGTHRTQALIWRVFTLGFWAWVLSVAVFFGILMQHSQPKTTAATTPVAIIVLGSKASNGIPSPALAYRLDTAAALAQKMPNALIVTTGGVGFGETISESVASSRYLTHQHHIAPERIINETTSTSTELNLVNSLTLLASHGISKKDPIAIVTSDFHTLRAAKIAQKQGITHASTYGAPTPLQTRYQAWLREYFAFISGYILKEY